MLKYDTLEQAQMRLTNVVITENGIPWYVESVENVDDNIMLNLRSTPAPAYRAAGEPADLFKTVRKQVPQDSPDLNFRIFDVGYINDKTSRVAVWPQRSTARQQHQGLTASVLNISNRAMFGSGFVEMMRYEYPSRAEAMRMLAEDNWTSVAISPDFAVATSDEHSAVRVLQYRGRTVGVAVGRAATAFVLNEEDAYLADQMEEQGLPFEIDAVEDL